MMKTSELLGRSFFISLIFWNSSGLDPAVTLICSDDRLTVQKGRPFNNDTKVKIDDIHVGHDCPLTRMLSSNYEFSYPVIYCGINKFVFQGNDVFLLSKVNYRPTLDITYTFQVIYFAKRLQFSSLIPFGMNGHDANMMGDSFEVTKEGQPLSAPNVSSSSKQQLFQNSWTSNGCVTPSFPPRVPGASGAPSSVIQFL